MILEQALLHVRAGEDDMFRAALEKACPLIAASPGFLGIKIRSAVEAPGTYLLLVSWETVAHHRDGFRCSDRYEQWCALLYGFYDPMPQVRYFGDLL